MSQATYLYIQYNYCGLQVLFLHVYACALLILGICEISKFPDCVKAGILLLKGSSANSKLHNVFCYAQLIFENFILLYWAKPLSTLLTSDDDGNHRVAARTVWILLPKAFQMIYCTSDAIWVREGESSAWSRMILYTRGQCWGDVLSEEVWFNFSLSATHHFTLVIVLYSYRQEAALILHTSFAQFHNCTWQFVDFKIVEQSVDF